MFLRAGLLSLFLLVVSRLLGLVRESAQAAAFGTTGLGDVVVLMLTLPDWMAGLLAGGALAYVLLPHWAQQAPPAVAATQRTVAHALLLLGALLAVLLWLGREAALAVLAAGVPLSLRGVALQAVGWSALALPAALLAALWSTRLQHERDFTGVYGANLVVNIGLILAMILIAGSDHFTLAIGIFGLFFVVTMLLRLVWQAWRLRRRGLAAPPAGWQPPTARAASALPPLSLWLWAGLSAGLPLLLPFVARSLASRGGEGALATFNYAWKLVELPLVLAIQLVASLAFPSITRAFAAQQADSAETQSADASVRGAMALSWTLACAAVAGLLLGAPAVAALLFGWGRMEPQALSRVAAWSTVGAWGLLPQALTAVALTVLAVQGRLRVAALAYGGAVGGLLLASVWAAGDGARLMGVMNLAFGAVALAVLFALGPGVARWLPGRVMLATALALALVALASSRLPATGTVTGLSLAVLGAALVLGAGGLAGPELRRALRR